MKLKIASWNVNGARACEKKGLFEWLYASKMDILCLQETKAKEEQLSEDYTNNKQYSTYFASAKKPGYSGVALFVNKKLGEAKITYGLNKAEFDDEGRTIIAEFDKFILFGCYFPNGQRDHGRVPYKLSYSEHVMKKALKLKKETGKEIIITGDYNTAHTEIDLKNAKSNKNTTGFLPIERQWLDKFISKGFIDIFRLHHPEEEGHYTWWTYRSNCRAKNVGWRIDYFFVTKDLVPAVKKSSIHPKVMGSDHCPISIEVSI